MKRILCYFLFFCVCIYMQAQTYDQLAARAVEAAERDSLELSEKLFEEALKLESANMRNSMLFSNLGTVQHRLGKIDKAIESYTLGLNLAPYSVTILLNRAALYLEKNLYEKAYLDYCNVIDIDRKNQEALLYRAYIYMQRRDYKEARIDYNTLLQEEPKNKMGRLGMALLNQKELKFREALEEFNRMITDYPNDASLLKARANLEIEMNTPDLALLDLESAAKLSPKDAEIYVMCGEIYLSQKKKREAYVAFEKAIELGVPRPELQDKLKASK